MRPVATRAHIRAWIGPDIANVPDNVLHSRTSSSIPIRQAMGHRDLVPGRRCHWLAIGGLFTTLIFSTSCRPKSDVDPMMMAEWVHSLYGTIRVERLSPPVASRITAYAASALYAGMAAVRPTLKPLNGVLATLPPLPIAPNASVFDATVVAVAAERFVLDSLLTEALPTTRAQLARLADSLVQDRVTNGVQPAMRQRSDSLGQAIGAVIVAWSRTDGFAETRTMAYVPPIGDGLWSNDAPGNIYATQNLSSASEFVALDNPANQQRAENISDRGLIVSRPKTTGQKTLPAANMAGATEPYWKNVRPFVLASWDACPVELPPQYLTRTTDTIYTNAQDVYDAKRHLSEEQRTIAYYWADNAGETGTPVGHWLSIASQMISERHLNADQSVQLILGTALAQADAFIATFGYKYQFNLLRPRTFIRRLIDPEWEPLIPTPSFPEYPSAHSTQSAAAARTITAFIGAAPFSDSTSIAVGHAVRQFPSFEAASEEAGLSRVYGGIHYPAGNRAGLAVGKCIGDKIFAALHTGTAPSKVSP